MFLSYNNSSNSIVIILKHLSSGKLSKLKITFYGTEEDPIRNSGLAKGNYNPPPPPPTTSFLHFNLEIINTVNPTFKL